jgi:hypothetical protein
MISTLHLWRAPPWKDSDGDGAKPSFGSEFEHSKHTKSISGRKFLLVSGDRNGTIRLHAHDWPVEFCHEYLSRLVVLGGVLALFHPEWFTWFRGNGIVWGQR